MTIDAVLSLRLEEAPAGHILVMGIAGTGKSEIANRLAKALGNTFIEADEYHSSENVERMRQGIGLTDEDRWPWLETVAKAALEAKNTASTVIACSALKRSYRDFLRAKIGVFPILYLTGSSELIGDRLSSRKGHFASGSLLESQMRAIEPPTEDELAVTLDIRLPPDALIADALAFLQRLAAVRG